MKTIPDDRYENITTPSSVAVNDYRAAMARKEESASLALIHYRGGETEFALGQQYCASLDPMDRAIGAKILGQLGWGRQAFHDESVSILIGMLEDSDDQVIATAAHALGFRGAESAVSPLLKLVGHDSPQVRLGVVHGLSGQGAAESIAALIALTADRDFDVRNWAVFELASVDLADSPAIREALRAALSDENEEIRGEALVGLAIRKDPSIVSDLEHEWQHEMISFLSIEAAAAAGDPRLLAQLEEFAATLPLDDSPYFREQLDSAISACGGIPKCD